MVNKETLDLITFYEGFVEHWYPDPAHGWKVPTCCYGHTDAAGEPKYKDTKNKKFTKEEGREILLRDLKGYEDAVDSLVTVPLNENRRGALVSFTYNLGKGNLKKSTLLKKVNAGDFEGATKEFSKWINAGGKPLEGLRRRRAAEAALFASGVTLAEPTEETPVEAPKATQEHSPTPKAPQTSFWLRFISAVLHFLFIRR